MEINYVAVAVCGVAALVIGSIWYGPLFGKAWMRIMGVENMSEEQKQMMKKGMWGMYLAQFIISLITAGVLAVHIAYWSDVNATALGIAICTWFGFILTTDAQAALLSGKPKNVAWKMFFINAGGQLVTFAVFGLILGNWT